ncbi:MAG: O-antigen ligase family protein [Bacteroidota bacterium]
MQQFIFKIGGQEYRREQSSSIREWAKREVILQKLDTPLGYFLMVGFAMILAWMVATSTVEQSIWLLANVVLLPCLLGGMLNLRFGLMMLVLFSFSLHGVRRLSNAVPLENYFGLFVIVLLFGILVKQTRQRNWSAYANPVTVAILIWVGYQLVQVLNPHLPHLKGWAVSIRSTIGYVSIALVVMYAWKNISDFKRIIYAWMGLATLAGLYGIVQYFLGLQDFELAWLQADRSRMGHYFSWDGLRAFSFLSDPSVLGLTMAASSLMGIGLLFGPGSGKRTKIILTISVLIQLIAMIFSHTNTAFVAFPAGFFFYALIRMKKPILLSASSLLVVGVVLLLLPAEDGVLRHIQKAFEPSLSASYQSQVQNQIFAQSYLTERPMGVGPGMTGTIGNRFSPYQIWSQFPQSSGFVQLALEQGWIGLLLFVGMILTTLIMGVRRYFHIIHEGRQNWLAIMLSVMLLLALGNYSQQVIMVMPTNVLFFILMGTIAGPLFRPGLKEGQPIKPTEAD